MAIAWLITIVLACIGFLWGLFGFWTGSTGEEVAANALIGLALAIIPYIITSSIDKFIHTGD